MALPLRSRICRRGKGGERYTNLTDPKENIFANGTDIQYIRIPVSFIGQEYIFSLHFKVGLHTILRTILGRWTEIDIQLKTRATKVNKDR